MKILAALALLLAAAALATGCGGDGDGSAGTTATTGPEPARSYPDEPAAGEALEAFIAAAAAKDTEAMFDLLTPTSQQRFGPTAEDFAKGPGKELGIVLGALGRVGGTYELVLSKRVSDVFAVSTVQGEVTAKGRTEYGAYAAVLREIDGAWKVDLAGTVQFNPLTPETGLKSDPTPTVATQMQAAEPVLDTIVFVDQEAMSGVEVTADGFVSVDVAEPLAPGRHVVTTYAETQSGAGANAYGFEVG